MILKSAIKDFLERPLDDHLWIKQATHADLDAALRELACAIYPNARLHQKACVLLGLTYPQFSFWLQMGTGKTLITLELLQYWWDNAGIKRALVLVTSDKAYGTWERQIAEYAINVPYIALEGSSAERWQQFRGFREGIILLTYPGAVAMVSRKAKGESWQLDNALVAELSGVDVFVMDESTRAGHRNSLTHELCRAIAQKVDIRYALAGRPFGRDPTMLWGQQLIIDDGATLGTTLGMFRAAFFDSTRNKNARGKRAKFVRDYVFRDHMMPELSAMARHRSITYTAKECIDLPAFVPIIESVKLPHEARQYYIRVVQQIREAQGNLREMKNAFIRMRQLSSGFLGMTDDETGERAQIAFEDNPKLDLLLDLLQDIPNGHGAVIFYDFTFSGRRIVAELMKRGEHCIWLWSGTKDARGDLNRFERDPDVRFAVIQNRVGAYSLDGLQHKANYLFFFESPVSCIDRDQAERRLLRQGQPHKVFSYDLVVEGTLDRRILDYHREGADLIKQLTAAPKNFFA